MHRSPLVATTLALALVLACKRDEPASTASAPASPSTVPSSPGTPPVVADPEPESVRATPTTKGALAELDPLLDLLPAGAENFAIVRDPRAVVEGIAWFVAGERDALAKLDAAKLAGYEPDPERDRMVRDIDTIAQAILGSVVQLDRGIVLAQLDGAPLSLIASPDPSVIPALVAKVRGVTETDALHCKPAPGHAGWVGCAAKAETVDAYVAAKQAGERRKQLAAEIAGGDIDRANVIVRVAGFPGGPLTGAIELAPGEIEMHVGMPALTAVDNPLAVGPTPALGLVAPAASFAWARVSSRVVAKAEAEAPPPFGTAVASVTGELLVAWIDKTGLVALAGVRDTMPISGLVPLVALAKDQIPKTLPDGSALVVEVRDVDDGTGKTRPTVLATLEPSAELRKTLDAIGLAPEAAAFAAGGYAALVIGSGKAAVPVIAGYSGSAATTATIAALPVGLQRAIADNRVAAILHVTLDGLQSSAVRKSLVETATLPAGDLDVGKAIEVAFDLLAPLSSLSWWVTIDGGAQTVHVAVRTFGDPTGAEGKDARATMLAANSGAKDAATAYGELSARWPGSPRKASYDARAGASVGQAASTAFLLGIVAAIAIPAVVKYRSRTAGGL